MRTGGWWRRRENLLLDDKITQGKWWRRRENGDDGIVKREICDIKVKLIGFVCVRCFVFEKNHIL